MPDTILINIGKQSRTVTRVLEEFDRQSRRAFRKHGQMTLMGDGIPLVVISIEKLFPRMRWRRRMQLSMQVFKIIENMHRLANAKPSSGAKH